MPFVKTVDLALFPYASYGIHTHDPSIIGKAILPSSVRVEQCLSRPNRASRSGAKCKSQITCHVPHTWQKGATIGHHRHPKKTPMVSIDQQSLSRIRQLVWSAALDD